MAKVRPMKRVLGGVALGLGLTAKAWAQSPPTAAFPAEPAPAEAPKAPAPAPAPPNATQPAPPSPPQTAPAQPPAQQPAPPANQYPQQQYPQQPPATQPPQQYPPQQYPPQQYPPQQYPPQQYPPQQPGRPYYEPPPPPEAKKPERNFSLSISPLHLVLPLVELTGELRVSDHVGLSVIAGYGSLELESNDPDVDETRASVIEVGAQASWYPLRKFESLVLGAEVLWMHLEADVGDITGIGAGVAVGPFVGYKLITRGGFTFLVQGGAQYLAVQAQAEDSAGARQEDEDSHIIPLINLNLGWSF
jgi:hypothetical protein